MAAIHREPEKNTFPKPPPGEIRSCGPWIYDHPSMNPREFILKDEFPKLRSGKMAAIQVEPKKNPSKMTFPKPSDEHRYCGPWIYDHPSINPQEFMFLNGVYKCPCEMRIRLGLGAKYVPPHRRAAAMTDYDEQ